MNKNYLPGEDGTLYGKRLNREMDAEVVTHKQRIAQALRNAGHEVEVPEDLERDYIGAYWKVDNQHIEMWLKKTAKGTGFFALPDGGLRITVGPYNNKKTFIKKVAEKELVKFPAGFDYETIARTMVDILKQEREREQERERAEKRAKENDAIALPAARRLAKEFGLQTFHDTFVGVIKTNRGRKELGLEFGCLTEEQARHILCAARDCGALKG